MNLPVAILAGGLATRLGLLTESIPKVLLDVAGKPFAFRQVELLKRHGLSKIVFCLGHLGEQVQDALGDGSEFEVELNYVFDGARPLGTGGALRKALPLLGDAFLVLYGDSYLDCDYQAISKYFVESDKDGLMTVFNNAGQWDRSNVIFRDGQIVQYDKVLTSPEMHHIDYGLGLFKSQAFSRYPEETSFDLTMVYQDLLARDKLAGYEVKSRFYEIGSIAGIEEMRKYFQKKDKS
ncbi:MAG: nucleotidyltransferase family protein, partial [Pyrinomonadaceae bacterium]